MGAVWSGISPDNGVSAVLDGLRPRPLPPLTGMCTVEDNIGNDGLLPWASHLSSFKFPRAAPAKYRFLSIQRH